MAYFYSGQTERNAPVRCFGLLQSWWLTKSNSSFPSSLMVCSFDSDGAGEAIGYARQARTSSLFHLSGLINRLQSRGPCRVETWIVRAAARARRRKADTIATSLQWCVGMLWRSHRRNRQTALPVRSRNVLPASRGSLSFGG